MLLIISFVNVTDDIESKYLINKCADKQPIWLLLTPHEVSKRPFSQLSKMEQNQTGVIFAFHIGVVLYIVEVVKQYAESQSVDNLTFMSCLPLKEVMEIYQQSNILYAHLT